MAATLDALKFTTLADLDPRLDVLIQAHLKRTANDCMDRAREPGAACYAVARLSNRGRSPAPTIS